MISWLGCGPDGVCGARSCGQLCGPGSADDAQTYTTEDLDEMLEEEMAEEANGNIECFIDETEHLLEAMET